MASSKEFSSAIREDGFAIVPDVLCRSEIARFISILDKVNQGSSVRSRGGVYAIRNLLDVIPELRQLADSPALRDLVKPVLGEKAIPVRGILFDKTLEANWKVPWHQDLSIAVQKRIDMEGFGPWTTKADVIHVQPPVHILEEMLAVRVHLDDCEENNAPVRVIPGSHRKGRMKHEQIQLARQSSGELSCPVKAGGVLLMRPLLLHASSPSHSPAHRRVVHIEFAACSLPGGLRWYSEN
jgi:hypothetical protein